jgi:hypothetical protein
VHELAVMSMPIEGSGITSRDNQMPGAPRHYRLGVHEGLDLYWQAGTPVRAATDGIVIRATTGYVAPDQAQHEYWQSVTRDLGQTPDEVADFYRGMQI